MTQLNHTPGAIKKGHMVNNYLTDTNDEAIVDFVKDDEELYEKAHEKFKDKAKKDDWWERYASCQNLSAKVCKT